MAALPLAPAGALYAAPPVPDDFAAHLAAAVVPAPILSSCHAVTTGPDRHLYWVYSGMVSSATAIITPVTPSCCFETQDSMAVSQSKNRKESASSTLHSLQPIGISPHDSCSSYSRICSSCGGVSCDTFHIEHASTSWLFRTRRICSRK